MYLRSVQHELTSKKTREVEVDLHSFPCNPRPVFDQPLAETGTEHGSDEWAETDHESELLAPTVKVLQGAFQSFHP